MSAKLDDKLDKTAKTLFRAGIGFIVLTLSIGFLAFIALLIFS